jgi:hypothetical protein
MHGFAGRIGHEMKMKPSHRHAGHPLIAVSADCRLWMTGGIAQENRGQAGIARCTPDHPA